MIAAFDTDLRLVYANRAAVVAMQLDDPAQAVGRHAEQLLGAEAYAANRRYIHTALQGAPARFERSLIEPGGVRYTQAVYAPMHGGDAVTGLVVAINEFTTRDNDHPELRAEIENEVLRPERHRIAEDFHDIVIQRLFAAALATGSAQRDPAGRTRWIRAASDSVRNAIAEARASIHNLKAAAETTDLPLTVASVVQHSASALGFSPSITYIGSAAQCRRPPSPPNSSRCSPRRLSNAARHAHASAVAITITTSDDEVTLTSPTTASASATTRPRAAC